VAGGGILGSGMLTTRPVKLFGSVENGNRDPHQRVVRNTGVHYDDDRRRRCSSSAPVDRNAMRSHELDLIANPHHARFHDRTVERQSAAELLNDPPQN
jgi:hypothetical protein